MELTLIEDTSCDKCKFKYEYDEYDWYCDNKDSESYNNLVAFTHCCPFFSTMKGS